MEWHNLNLKCLSIIIIIILILEIGLKLDSESRTNPSFWLFFYELRYQLLKTMEPDKKVFRKKLFSFLLFENEIKR